MVDGAAPADLSLRPGGRLALLAPALPRGCVVVLAAAAWVHTGLGPPGVIDIALPTPVRDRFGPVRPHCTRYDDADLHHHGSACVTTPEQTAADLARTLTPAALTGATAPADPATPDGSTRERVLALRSLLDGGVSTRAALAVVHRQPARARARRARAVLAAIEELEGGTCRPARLREPSGPRARERRRGGRP